jgi:hypothetical protein
MNLEQLKKRFVQWLMLKFGPTDEELIMQFVVNTATLELLKSQVIELAPIQGCCGHFLLAGNCLPVVTYRVFEKSIMEFIQVRVEVGKPNVMRFITTIDAIGTGDPARHGEEVECKDVYKEPFLKLIRHLYYYFPYRNSFERPSPALKG